MAKVLRGGRILENSEMGRWNGSSTETYELRMETSELRNNPGATLDIRGGVVQLDTGTVGVTRVFKNQGTVSR